MSKKRADPVVLDRAYDNGKLAGILGFETSEACPFGSDQPAPRIAWLDGFADGVWKGAFHVNTAGRSGKIVRPMWGRVIDRTLSS